MFGYSALRIMGDWCYESRDIEYLGANDSTEMTQLEVVDQDPLKI
jgi:hypothetical protein